MKAIRVRVQLDSTTVRIPEIASLVGSSVEILVLEDEEAARRSIDESIRSSPHPVVEAFGEALVESGALRLA